MIEQTSQPIAIYTKTKSINKRSHSQHAQKNNKKELAQRTACAVSVFVLMITHTPTQLHKNKPSFQSDYKFSLLVDVFLCVLPALQGG